MQEQKVSSSLPPQGFLNFFQKVILAPSPKPVSSPQLHTDRFSIKTSNNPKMTILEFKILAWKIIPNKANVQKVN